MHPLSHPLRWCSFVLLLAMLACALPATATAVPAPATLPAPGATTAPSEIPATPTPTSTAAAPSIDLGQLKQGLDAAIPAIMQSSNSAACSLAVVDPDPAAAGLRTQFFNYGTLSRESTTPVDSTTEYEIGSVTKLFTADVLALNVQAGTMNLDDPLQKYLPSNVHVPAYNGQVITLKELSTHTSGLPRTLPSGSTVSKVNGIPMWGYNSEQDIFDFLDTYQLTRAPGAKWEYSNLANGLLGIAEAQLGQTSYEALVTEKITGPLGMNDTHIVLPPAAKARLAQGYTTNGKIAPITATQGGTLAAGAIRSTTHDLAIYLAANIDPQGKKLASVLQMTQQQHDKGPKQNVVMGLGWLIANPGAANELFNKDGSTLGYNSYIAFSRSKQTGFVALCNGHPISGLLAPIEKLLNLVGGTTDDNQ